MFSKKAHKPVDILRTDSESKHYMFLICQRDYLGIKEMESFFSHGLRVINVAPSLRGTYIVCEKSDDYHASAVAELCREIS